MKEQSKEERMTEYKFRQTRGIIENTDELLDNLRSIRDQVKEALDSLPEQEREGWRGQIQSTDTNSINVHFQRVENAPESNAKLLAKALNAEGEWHRYGSQYQAGLRTGLPFVTVMIHEAESARQSPDIVAL